MLFDILGAFFSLLATYYFIKINKLAWLITLIATSINSYLYWQKGIYADMLLEFFYFCSACYGWYLWDTKKNTVERPIIYKLNIKQWTVIFVLLILFYFFFKYLLERYTYSTVAQLDALTTALSLVAQGLMSFKIIFTWFFWLLTDLLYAYLYFSKGIPIHTGLMFLYLGMAIMGYYKWNKKKDKTSLATNASFELTSR